MIRELDVYKRQALMEACVAFKKDTINLLLKRGADVNLGDNNGTTALMRAAYGGYASLVEDLLGHGADKDLVDKEGNKAIHYVRSECLAQLKPILK